MKIALISNYNPNYRNTNLYRENAIKKLGHSFFFVDDRNFIFPGRLRQRYPSFQRIDLSRLNKNISRQLLNENPDFCLFAGGFRTNIETLSKLREAKIQTALWTSDAPIQFENIIKTAPYYNNIFCSGTEAIEIFAKNGIKNPIWIPFGCDPDYHRSIELNVAEKAKYKKDIVFVGAYYPNRWEILKNLNEYNIGIWGPNWNQVHSDNMRNISINDTNLDVSEWVKIYNGAKLVIVIHFQNGKIPCYQASPKVYEALACKSFVLVDQQKDVFSIFKDNYHLAGFKDPIDLMNKVEYYLNQSELRKKIACAGYEEVRRNHTYKHRIIKMLSIIKKLIEY